MIAMTGCTARTEEEVIRQFTTQVEPHVPAICRTISLQYVDNVIVGTAPHGEKGKDVLRRLSHPQRVRLSRLAFRLFSGLSDKFRPFHLM
ncbi:MAG: hypothetical protein IPK53_20565 [bacterium]|nr:hypothetical protein [bacterium]